MKKTITLADFQEAFLASSRKDHFSPRALEALYEYYEELESETGCETELDVTGLCVEWAEYTSEQDYYDHGFPADQAVDKDLIIVPGTMGFLIQN